MAMAENDAYSSAIVYTVGALEDNAQPYTLCVVNFCFAIVSLKILIPRTRSVF